ncbi:MAG: hypothetical protein PVH29_13735 [Candidatus Zixiibacteriota bacterium]|jgi:hypothetical protein
MAIRKEATIEHGFTQDEITAAVKATLEKLWGCQEKEPALFESDIGMSLNSFGEVFTVDLTEAGAIKIASETKLPTALTDWGKNQGNIDKFLAALKETLAASGLAESKAEAYASLAEAGTTQVRDASSRREGWSTILLIGLIAAVLIVLAVVCIVGYWVVSFFLASI